MLKIPSSPQRRPRRAGTGPPRPGTPRASHGADHRARPDQLAAHARAARARADDPRRRSAAGSKLNEAAVAALLGVSRGPVREAFRALEESGLVRLEKNRGVFVRQIGVEEADEIYELRAVLDEFVGRRVAQTATPAKSASCARSSSGWSRRRRAATSTPTTSANLAFPRPAGRARGQREAARHLPAARQRAAISSAARRSRRPARCRSRRASTARSSTRSPPARPPPPAARCTSTSWRAASGCTARARQRAAAAASRAAPTRGKRR